MNKVLKNDKEQQIKEKDVDCTYVRILKQGYQEEKINNLPKEIEKKKKVKKVINFETAHRQVFVPIENIEAIEIHEVPRMSSNTEIHEYRPTFVLKSGKELREVGTYHSKDDLCKKIEHLFETGEWLD